jgi:hypothetical protein
MPKIVDNNLKVVFSEESKNTIAYLFRNFRVSRVAEREDQAIVMGKPFVVSGSFNKPASGNHNQETEETDKHFTPSSPPKPTTTTIITELPELHCPQHPVSPKLAAREEGQPAAEEPLLSKPAEDTPGTFRQIEKMGDLSAG